MGLLYLVQPAELVGTNRYKIGCSSKSNLSRVRNGYRKGTRYLLITECENPFEVEKTIKDEFCKEFNLIAGTEYFEGDEIKIRKLFYKIYEIVLSNVIKKNDCVKQLVIKDDDTVKNNVIKKDNVVDDIVTTTNDKFFECIRCGYTTQRKYNLITHLKRKRVCEPEILDIERDILLDELSVDERRTLSNIIQESPTVPKSSKEGNKTNTQICNTKVTKEFSCINCGKTFNHKNNMYRHKKHRCKNSGHVDMKS